VNVPLLVANGELDLGMGSSFTTMNMQADGIPGETVAAFLQKDPQTIVTHAEDNIKTLADLKGHPIMIAKFSQQEFWQFLKQRYGFTDDQLRPYTYSAAPYLADIHAAQQGYITEDGYMLGSQMDKPPVSILLADYGYERYAATAFGMKPWIDAHKDVVKRFIDATAHGYADCTSGEAEPGMKLMLEANPEHGEPLYHYKLKVMRERTMVAGPDGIGGMTDARWKSFFDLMSEAGVYPKTLNYKTAYTLEFTPGLPK
jgi:NitT/TauT family transport system substrate-binding protein